MLSYQHSYHAGNLADVHKHAALAWMLDYLTRKPKPLSYVETHAGRGVYDLSSSEAAKTGEAARGIAVADTWFAPDHPYRRALQTCRATRGASAYPGSPLIAQSLLRASDHLHLAELHPGEHAALRAGLRAPNTQVYRQDGMALALSLCPPDPRRGLMLIDPSWEVKAEYQTLPRQIAQITRKWNVGVVMLWYPILKDAPHRPMVQALRETHPGVLVHEVRFAPARKGHGMTGSGLCVINPPFGLDPALQRLGQSFAAHSGRGA